MTLAVSMASDYKNRLFVDWVGTPSKLQSTNDKRGLVLREKKFQKGYSSTPFIVMKPPFVNQHRHLRVLFKLKLCLKNWKLIAEMHGTAKRQGALCKRREIL